MGKSGGATRKSGDASRLATRTVAERRGRNVSMAERRTTTTVARPKAPKAPRAPKAPKPMSSAQRNKLATQGIVNAVEATDEKAAVTAALEAIHERLASDTELRNALRQKYQEIAALNPKPPVQDLGPAPVPIRSRESGSFSPYGKGKYNPYQLLYEYGDHQLRAVLVRASQTRLREAVAVVREREPDTTAPNRNDVADMINYIMRHVAPGY